MARVSTRFGLFLFPLLLSLGFSTAVVFLLVKDIGVNDHYLKSSGSIRTGIQRTAKLMLAGQESADSIALVDRRFSEILNDAPGLNLYQKPRDEFLSNILKLKTDWERLTVTRKPRDILQISEEVWSLDQTAADFTEALTQRKKQIFGFLFFAIAFNFVITLYIIFMNFRLVKNYLEPAAHYDTLTSILSRRSFQEQFTRDFFLAARLSKPLSLITFDIDHFKRINDTLGHDAGDHVLVRLASLVRENLRRDDSFARVGGEEFSIILSGEKLATASELAEKIRRAVASNDFGSPSTVTISLGVAEIKSGDQEADLVKRADLALYRAKEGGRNRVETAP